MKKPMNQFLDALRGLEKLNTPISGDAVSLGANPDGQNNNSGSMSEMVSLQISDKYLVEFEIKPAEGLNEMGKHNRRNSIFNDVRQTVEQIQSSDYAFRAGDTFETSKHKITFKIVSI